MALVAGNVLQVTNPRTAGQFTADLCETYGPTHKIHGALGVSAYDASTQRRSLT